MAYLKQFSTLAGKAAATPTGLKNDFSGVLYLVNNQGRRSQAELCLAREVAGLPAAEASIIPPDIQTYKTGFFYLAGELLYGNFPRENLALFTEEGLDFLLYELLWSYAMSQGAGDYGDLADYPEEKHKIRNLASDFKKFIALVNEEEKNAALAGLAAKPEFRDTEPYKKLFAALELYEKRVADFKADRQGSCFFSPLEACRELLQALATPAALKVQPASFHETRVIVVEDLDAMEPLFRTLVKALRAAGFKVEETTSAGLRPEVAGGLELKGFITSLDEAEYVGWRIKKLLAEEKVKEGEISAACFSRETGALLPLVFSRYGLQAASAAPAAASHLFRAYAAAVRIALDLQPEAGDYLELFNSPVSAFRLSRAKLNAAVPGEDRKTIRELVLQAGYKASVNREDKGAAHWINAVLKEPRVAGLFNSEEQKAVENLLALPALAGRSPSVFSDLLAVAVDMKNSTDSGLAQTLGRLATRADKAFAACGGGSKERELLAGSLLSLMAETEYYPRGEERADTYRVPILSPDRLLNSSAGVIFACGLTGEADKLKKLPVPEKLAAALGLTAAGRTYPEQLRDAVYKDFSELAQAGAEKKLGVVLTYGYNNIGGDMAGMSNLVRAVKKFYGLTDNKGGAVPSLYAAHELMLAEGEKAPDASYALKAQAAPRPAAGAAAPVDLSAKVAGLAVLTMLRVREKNKNRKDSVLSKTDGLPLKVSVGVRDFASFMNCPRKFINKMFLEAAGIQEERDHESQIPLNKGNFWHKVYEDAARAEEFYSADKDKIRAALAAAFEKLAAEPARDPETFQDLPIEDFREESGRLFDQFAANEAERQAKLPGLKGLKREVWCSKAVHTVALGEEKIEIEIYGRVDRVDCHEAGGKTWLHVWDYKTGKKKALSFGESSQTTGQFAANSEPALQLALYAWMLSKKPESVDLPSGSVGENYTGLNIFRDGSLKFNGNYEENAASLAVMVGKIEKTGVPAFQKFLETGTLAAMDMDYKPVAQKALPDAIPVVKPLYNPDCGYCHTHLCRFISLGGLKGEANA